MPITQQRLHEVCWYDPVAGTLNWKEPGKKRLVGSPIGSVGSHGYVETSIDGGRYLVHRLIWLYHRGTFPEEHTDHINHMRTDNRIENLRAVTNRQNNFNQSKRTKRTTSVWKGVSWASRRNKWKAQIKVGTRHLFLGYFDSEVIAALAYSNAAKKHYGPYANPDEVEW